MNNNIDISAIVTLIKCFDYEMLSDYEWNVFKEIDPSNEEEMLKALNQVIVPEYESMDELSQKLIKSSLVGMLSCPGFDCQQVLRAVEMPFEPIEEPGKFFSLIWFVLFKERFS